MPTAVVLSLLVTLLAFWLRDRLILLRVHRENHQLRHDPVTGLLTRQPWTQQARHRLPRLAKPALVMLDLNHFKQVNDQFGHHAGDAVLGEFARLLRHQFGPGALIGRFGGDEFVILLDLAGRENPHAMGSAFAGCVVAWQDLRCGAAAGAACPADLASCGHSTGRNGEQLERLLRAADLACSRAKARCHEESLLTATEWYCASDPAVPDVLEDAPTMRPRDQRRTSRSLFERNWIR